MTLALTILLILGIAICYFVLGLVWPVVLVLSMLMALVRIAWWMACQR